MLTDGSGRWFDPAKCTRWDEGTRWDGRNHVSLATGSQWDHEELFRTPAGRWIIHWWSQWEGSTPSYREIEPAEAAEWLIANGWEPPDELAGETAALEVG
jgi:hypothetical protein